MAVARGGQQMLVLSANSMWFEVTKLLDSWGPLQECGESPEIPTYILQALQHIGECCTLGKKKGLLHVATAICWLMLPPLCNITEKQVEAHTAHLEKELI